MANYKQYPGSSLIQQKIRNYCSYQERCISEVEDKLKNFSVQKDKIPGIINQLQKEGYLDEERFARAYAGGKFRLNKWGRNKIEFELRIRGIPELIIQEGLTEIEEEDYRQTLRELMDHKYREIKSEENVNIKEKILKFAYGKGYEMEIILILLKEMKI